MTRPALLLLLLIAILLAALIARGGQTIVFEYERALRFRRGRLRGLAGPGLYWHGPFTRFQKIDVRPSRIAVSGQEVLTADGVAIKASIAATYQVADVERAVLGSDNYLVAIHTELQLALRAIASSQPIEQLLQQRGEIPVQLKEIAAPRLQAIGIDLQDAALRDLTFPGELKKIFTQVVKARQEGLATLEKARGETAALRSLANAASLIERNPSLMHLRALQILAQQPGNTLVLGLQPGATPIPLRDRRDEDVPAQREPPESD